ncbi:hypothetical protein, conserved [Angomonas deanei]|uniref:Uncharacterized protein n=1 Tax=Angomonas deanei TaxID=59799 RepID=A0A7G2CSA2_9TRYP|nr:hypothetical protein, conserved [Angomonas deanei]
MHKTKPTGKLDMDAVQTRMEEEVHRLLVEGGYEGTHRHRTRLVTMSNRFDEVYCTLQGSAALSGVRLTSLGYKEGYNFMRRLRAVVDYAAAQGLDDEDVIVWVDSDTVLTGRDTAAAVADYVLHSAPSEAQLDVAAVRAWEDYGPKEAGTVLRSMTSRADDQQQWQYPPVLYNAENGCALDQFITGYCGAFVDFVDALTEVSRERLTPGKAYTMEEVWKVAVDFMTKESPTVVTKTNVQKAASDIRITGRLNTPLAERLEREKKEMAAQFSRTKRVYVSPRREGERPSFHPPYSSRQKTPLYRHINAGAYIGRVWALKKLVTAFQMVSQQTNARHVPWHRGNNYYNDQAVLGMLYYTQRLWEVEYGLLEAPPPAAGERRTMTPFDIPVGLMGLDKRRRFFGIDIENPGEQRREIFLPPFTGAVRESRTGALLAVYQDEQSVPLSWHYAGQNKPQRSEEAQFSYSWMVSSFLSDDVYRHNSDILSQYTIELISGKERYYGDFMTICGNPLAKRK